MSIPVEGEYCVERTLNNNVVVVVDASQREFILIGKGIGFGAKQGSQIDVTDERLEKRFSLLTEENRTNFQQLFSIVSPAVVGLAEEIVAAAMMELQQDLHEHIHIALADHIGFALNRLRTGINIENPFTEEIRTLYYREWHVAESGARLIEDRFGVPIPDEEIGFMTLHIHSAINARGISEIMRVTDAVKVAIQVIEQELGQKIPRDQLSYARMIIHLRFAIQRMLRGQPIVNPLGDAVAEKLKSSYAIAERASSGITKRIGISFPADEVAYLALHIARFTDL